MLDDKEIEILEFEEELPTVEINIIYNKHFITTAPKKFIKDFIGYNIEL